MVFSVRMCLCFKQKTAYYMRISDWSSDVCSSDLAAILRQVSLKTPAPRQIRAQHIGFEWISRRNSNGLSGKGRAPRQCAGVGSETPAPDADRKSTRLNSSH